MAFALSAPLDAHAQAVGSEHPAFIPTRDVAVEYQVHRTGERMPLTERMYFSAGDTRARFESPGHNTYVIMDHAHRRMFMVMARRRTYLEKPLSPSPAQGFALDESMHFTRAGTDIVAGQSCTVWAIRAEARSMVACITADGVLLRAQDDDPGRHGSRMEAKSVVYAPQDHSLFHPPADYQRMKVAQAEPPG